MNAIGRGSRLRAGLALACALLCAAAWGVGHGLTREELGRLLKVVDTRGSRTTIPEPVASVLKPKPSQHTPDVKQAAFIDEKGNKHGFAPLHDGSGFFLFSAGASVGQTVYVVDPDLRLLHAARSLSLVRGAPLLALPEAEGKRELDDELARWSKVLSPGGPAVPAAAAGKPLAKPPAPPKPAESKSQ